LILKELIGNYQMSEEDIDFIGECFWYGMFLLPIIIFPLVWRYSKMKNIYKILVWILLSALLSSTFLLISLVICFRNGMGPS
jgi:hypothetical protein